MKTLSRMEDNSQIYKEGLVQSASQSYIVKIIDIDMSSITFIAEQELFVDIINIDFEMFSIPIVTQAKVIRSENLENNSFRYIVVFVNMADLDANILTRSLEISKSI